MRNKIVATAVSATVAVMTLNGCSNMKTFNQPHDERSEGRVIDDKNITKSVQERLKKEPVYKFESVEVHTFGGIVQLSGFVNLPDQKRRAEEIARSTSGASQVVNALLIKPTATEPQPLTPTGQSTGERLTPSSNVNANTSQPTHQ